MTLLTRYDRARNAARALPNLKRLLIASRGRSLEAAFPSRGSGIRLQEIPDVKDEAGLFRNVADHGARPAHRCAHASGGAGQYVVW